MKVDVLAIGAHPDDVELGVGGLVCKLCQAGYRVVIVDLTEGELASRGTVAERRTEAENAAAILGVAERENVGLPDGGLVNTPEQRRILARFIRKYRPQVLLAPMKDDRHPDHHAAHFLAQDANYFAGVAGVDAGHSPYRVPHVYYYRVYGDSSSPQFVIDVSAQMEKKLEALRAYRSQFHNPDYQGEPTYVASPEFWESIQARAASLGARIGVACAEGLHIDTPVVIELPIGLEPPA